MWYPAVNMVFQELSMTKGDDLRSQPVTTDIEQDAETQNYRSVYDTVDTWHSLPRAS